MKKFIALALTIAMIATLGVIAFATGEYGTDNGTTTAPNGDTLTQNATLKINTTNLVHKYRIDVEWSDVELEINAGKTWNVTNHEYEYVLSDGADSAVSVKVTNHSDEAIKATLTATSTIDGLSMDAVDATVATGVGRTFAGADVQTLNGTLIVADGATWAENTSSETFTDKITFTLTLNVA